MTEKPRIGISACLLGEPVRFHTIHKLALMAHSPAAYQELGRQGQVPLIVPITLVRHYVRRLAVPYLAGQIYLDPHPRELTLRNHV